MNVEQAKKLIEQGNLFDWDTLDLSMPTWNQHCVYAVYDVWVRAAYIGHTKWYQSRINGHNHLLMNGKHHSRVLQNNYDNKHRIICFCIQLAPCSSSAEILEVYWMKMFSERLLNANGRSSLAFSLKGQPSHILKTLHDCEFYDTRGFGNVDVCFKPKVERM